MPPRTGSCFTSRAGCMRMHLDVTWCCRQGCSAGQGCTQTHTHEQRWQRRPYTPCTLICSHQCLQTWQTPPRQLSHTVISHTVALNAFLKALMNLLHSLPNLTRHLHLVSSLPPARFLDVWSQILGTSARRVRQARTGLASRRVPPPLASSHTSQLTAHALQCTARMHH